MSLILGRRDSWALVFAVIALVVALFAVVRCVHLTRAHNDLVAQLNRDRAGLGAALEAVGIPGGKIIGDILDSRALTPEEKAARSLHKGKQK